MAEKPTQTSLPPKGQPDPTTDSNFDYDQQPDPEGEGVPMDGWSVEAPFDSADWLDKPPIRYADDPPDKEMVPDPFATDQGDTDQGE